jgi:hypothetical protein
MARTVWFVATASLTGAIFLRQAICLGMHNPRRPIRWVCGAVLFCVSCGTYRSIFLPKPRFVVETIQ